MSCYTSFLTEQPECSSIIISQVISLPCSESSKGCPSHLVRVRSEVLSHGLRWAFQNHILVLFLPLSPPGLLGLFPVLWTLSSASDLYLLPQALLYRILRTLLLPPGLQPSLIQETHHHLFVSFASRTLPYGYVFHPAAILECHSGWETWPCCGTSQLQFWYRCTILKSKKLWKLEGFLVNLTHSFGCKTWPEPRKSLFCSLYLLST